MYTENPDLEERQSFSPRWSQTVCALLTIASVFYPNVFDFVLLWLPGPRVVALPMPARG